MKIREITEFRKSDFTEVLELLSALTSRAVIFTESQYREQVASLSSHLFFAYSKDGDESGIEVLGMLSLGVYLCPTGKKAMIEDVVVKPSEQGKGIGRELVSHALSFCRAQLIDSVMLTSRPERIAANKLYLKLGFEVQSTNYYHKKL